MRLTCKAVKSACIAVTNKLIKFCRTINVPKFREKIAFMKPCYPIKILTGIEDVPQLVFQLIWLISDTAVQIRKIAVKIVIYLKIHTGRLMEQNPACASENLYIPLIVGWKPRKYGVSESLFSSYP